MEYELRAAREKLERKQREEKERARRKFEAERRAKEAARVRQEATEAEQRARRLEEAAAADSARKQEEEDVALGDGILFSCLLKAVRLVNASLGDRIMLPPTALAELTSQGALDKGPMFFELSLPVARPRTPPKPQNSAPLATSSLTAAGLEALKVAEARRLEEPEPKVAETHAGALEFTAVEGTVGLPDCISQCLWQGTGNDWQGQSVQVRYVRLPKGTYARLQPVGGSGFYDVPDHKAALENALRGHATLTVGDVLKVRHGGVDHTLKVLELRPEPQVTVLETDMEVDVDPPSDADSRIGRAPLLKIGAPPVQSSVSEGQYVYFRCQVEAAMVRAMEGGIEELVLDLEIEGAPSTSDADLYISFPPNFRPSQHLHQYSLTNFASKKTLTISNPPKPIPSQVIIGVHGYKGKISFKLSITTQPQTSPREGGVNPQISETLGGVTPDKVQCSNCGQLVPVASATLHEAYCRRHNTKCSYPGCTVVMKREELAKHTHCEVCGLGSSSGPEEEKHKKVEHGLLECVCGAKMPMREMVKHKEENCPERMITCRFCGDLVRTGAPPEDAWDRLAGLSAHEALCGARTASCDTCRRVVRLKDMAMHQAALHAIGAIAPVPLMADTPMGTPESGVVLPTATLTCPICNKHFQGAAAEQELNVHLNDHDSGVPSVDEVMQDAVRSRSMNIECPICGQAVHSERDLSMHMDMVH